MPEPDELAALAKAQAAARKFFLPALAVVLLAACAGGGDSTPENTGDVPDEPADGLLEPVASDAQFVAAMSSAVEAPDTFSRTGLELPPEVAQDLTAGSAIQGAMSSAVARLDASTPTATTAPVTNNFSLTYTLEKQVDEADIVKYNGQHLFVAQEQVMVCCFIDPLPVLRTNDAGDTPDTQVALSQPPATSAETSLETTVASAAALADLRFAPEYLPPDAIVRVLETDTQNALANAVATIRLEERGHVNGLHLHDDKLVAISTGSRFAPYGIHFLDYYTWFRQQVNLDIYSVENPAEPVPLHAIEIEGGLVESRRIGNTLYVITRHTPPVHIYGHAKPAVLTAENQAIDERDAEVMTAEKLIPKLTLDGVKRRLFDPTDCWVANARKNPFDRPGYPVLTSITAIPLHAPVSMHTTCYNENVAGLYMSQSALYLTELRYREGQETLVHKFALNEIKPEYRGSAIVPGHIWHWGHNDFRINEHNGQLRMVTTVNTGNWQEDAWDHRLFVLEESLSETALDIVAELPNELRPAPIGKPNENLFGVRFSGERAYLVTFEQIDPLYVVDLSDSRDPKIAGELEVPGVSVLLHPVSDTLLLGVGNTQWPGSRLKLELFDVSDLANPASRSVQYIGDEGQGSYSEASHNRHAFAYLPLDETTDRFALPANVYGGEAGTGTAAGNALHLFEIAGKDNPASAGILRGGTLVPGPAPEPFRGGSNQRPVLHDDAVFFVSGGWVWSSLWQQPDQVSGPQ